MSTVTQLQTKGGAFDLFDQRRERRTDIPGTPVATTPTGPVMPMGGRRRRSQRRRSQRRRQQGGKRKSTKCKKDRKDRKSRKDRR